MEKLQRHMKLGEKKKDDLGEELADVAIIFIRDYQQSF